MNRYIPGRPEFDTSWQSILHVLSTVSSPIIRHVALDFSQGTYSQTARTHFLSPLELAAGRIQEVFADPIFGSLEDVTIRVFDKRERADWWTAEVGTRLPKLRDRGVLRVHVSYTDDSECLHAPPDSY